MSGNNKNPTLSDIWQKLGGQDAKLEQIHEQVKKTNGRVTRLEEWKARADVIAEYLKENPSQPQQTQQEKKEAIEGWSAREKTLTAIILSLLAIISALVGAGAIKP